MSTTKGFLMNPNFPPPQPDPNSSSLAYLNNLLPGAQPHYRVDPAADQPQLRNRPAPDRAALNPQQDLMGVDTGEETSTPVQDASPDSESRRGLKRAQPDTGDAEILEHSEPVCKQRLTDAPESANEASTAASVFCTLTT